MEVLNIDILEEISGWGYDFRRIASSIKSFKGEKIVLPINSYGGAVLEGFAIYNALLAHPSKVETQIVGYAISMGTIIALAGDEVKMPENGMFMIHEPWNVTGGDAEDMRHEAEVLENFANQLAGIYSQKTGISRSDIRDMMKKETWLNAKQAKKLGFIDTITKGADISAKFNANEYKNIPKSLVDTKGKENKKDGIHVDQNQINNKTVMIEKFKAFFAKEGQNIEELSQDDMVKNLADALNPAITSSVNNAIQDKFASFTTQLQANADELKTLKEKVEAINVEDSIKTVNDTIKAQDETIKSLKNDLKSIQDSKTEMEATLADMQGKRNPNTSSTSMSTAKRLNESLKGLDGGLESFTSGL